MCTHNITANTGHRVCATVDTLPSLEERERERERERVRERVCVYIYT